MLNKFLQRGTLCEFSGEAREEGGLRQRGKELSVNNLASSSPGFLQLSKLNPVAGIWWQQGQVSIIM